VTRDDKPAAEGLTTAAALTAGRWGEALRAIEQQSWKQFGRAPVGLMLAGLTSDRGCVCVAVNETYCELSGSSREEISGAEFLSFFHPEDQPALDLLLEDVLAGATDQIGTDARLIRKDGEIAWVRLTGSVIRPSVGERYLAVFVEDITASRQARAEIMRLERELQRSRRLGSLGQLVGGISHDFSNTLTVIANYASLIRDELVVAEATESAAKWGPVRWDVEQIAEAADHAKGLIRHLVAFAKRQETEPVLVDLGQMISDAAGLLSEVLGENVPIVIRQADGLWEVQADPGQLQQAIVNIALNARDAMPAGGQVVIDTANIDMENLPADWQGTAELAELLPGRYVAFRVADAGTGMDVDTAGRAFEPFFTTKGGDSAAGLGLPVVRRFAIQAGGNAWLRSEPGKGTTVTVVLPAADGSASPAIYQAPARESAGRLLVVDDEVAIRSVAHRVLTAAGYQVATASNGDEAVRLLGDPDLSLDMVLTDIVMPGMTGAALAAQARALRPGLPILFMSGYDRPDIAGGGIDPFAQIISKPFSRSALLAKVSQMLTAGAGAETGPPDAVDSARPGNQVRRAASGSRPSRESSGLARPPRSGVLHSVRQQSHLVLVRDPQAGVVDSARGEWPWSIVRISGSRA
jgi:two-component system cell cycle sensor histidine kinase/response regulator CckA